MNRKNLNSKQKIKFKIRKKINGTPERPRLAVNRSLTHFYAQLIDDVNSKTLLSISTNDKDVIEKIKDIKGKVNQSKTAGKLLAEKAVSAKYSNVVFDRGGYLYHGRVKAFADGAREGGLKF